MRKPGCAPPPIPAWAPSNTKNCQLLTQQSGVNIVQLYMDSGYSHKNIS